MSIYEYGERSIKVEIGDVLYRMDYHLSGVKYRITKLPTEETYMNGEMKVINGVDGMDPEETEKLIYNYHIDDIGKLVFRTPESARRGYKQHDFRKDPMI